MTYEPSIELAERADVPVLEQLIARSAWALCSSDYSKEQVEGAIGSVWGVDTQLIDDGTYFVVRAGAGTAARGDGTALDDIVACGGWSYRETLFGANAYSQRSPRELVPGTEAARVRAFFVCPEWARRGLGRRLLERCEVEARARGFVFAELMATRTGVRLYRACGYVPGVEQSFPLPNGESIEFVPMSKRLSPGEAAVS